MTFRQRFVQYFFVFLGGIFVIMFLIRWLAPDARTVLWAVLCPPTTHIEISAGVAELEPGEVVSAYEIQCVGEGVRQPLSDFLVLMLETGVSLGLALSLAVVAGWVTSRKQKN